MEKVTRGFLVAFKKRIGCVYVGPSFIVIFLFRTCLLGGIRGYQKLISPLLGNCCRFYPSCSVYAAEILRSDLIPLHRGLLFILTRLLRCHPYCKGGIDLPPAFLEQPLQPIIQPIKEP
jgi:putative membrane protein insertion efficiency factor